MYYIGLLKKFYVFFFFIAFVSCVCFSNTLFAKAGRFAYIKGHISELQDGDTIYVLYYRHRFLGQSPVNERKLTGIVIQQNFSFRLIMDGSDELAYFDIIFPSRLSNLNLVGCILANGQQINIGTNNKKIIFKGKSASIFNYKSQLDTIYRNCILRLNWQAISMAYNYNIISTAIDRCLGNSLTLRDFQNDRVIQALRYSNVCSLLSTLYFIANNNGDSSRIFIKNIEEVKNAPLFNYLSSRKEITDVPSFPALVKQRYDCLYREKDNKNLSYTYIDYAKSKFYGFSLSQIIVYYLYKNRHSNLLTTTFLNNSMNGLLYAEQYKSVLEHIKNYSPGSQVPDFRLYDTLGTKVNISRYKGNILLLDFWFTGCGACIASHKIIDSVMARFKYKNVRLVSVSKDVNFQVWLKSVHSGLYTNDEAINVFTGKLGMKHPVIQYFDINSFPTFIIIDKDGQAIGSPISPLIDNGKDLFNKIDKELSE